MKLLLLSRWAALCAAFLPDAAALRLGFGRSGLVSPWAGLPRRKLTAQEAKLNDLAEAEVDKVGNTFLERGSKVGRPTAPPTQQRLPAKSSGVRGTGKAAGVGEAAAPAAVVGAETVQSDIELYHINPALLVEWAQTDEIVVVEVIWVTSNLSGDSGTVGDAGGGSGSSMSLQRLSLTDFELEAVLPNGHRCVHRCHRYQCCIP